MAMMIKRVETASEWRALALLRKRIVREEGRFITVPDAPREESTVFMAVRDGKPRSACSAQMQPFEQDIGTIGAFVSVADPQAADGVLRAAATELRRSGARRILGPMDGDTWHHYRLNVGPYDKEPFVKEPWNPEYYPRLWESAGFSVAERYDSFLVEEPGRVAEKQKRFYERCLKRGYRFEAITAKNYRRYLGCMYELSCEIFADNLFYSAVSEAEFMRMYQPARALLKKGLSWMAYDSAGRASGYIFCYPDYAQAVRTLVSVGGVVGKVAFLMFRGKAARTCMKTLGVRPSKRRVGLTAALTHLAFLHCERQGFRQMLMCLMHSANDSHRFSGGDARHFRSYALYEYTP